VLGYEVVSEALQIPGPKPAGNTEVTLTCPAGKLAVGAGFNTDVTRSEPRSDGTGWVFAINHPTIDAGGIYQSSNSIVCVNSGATTG
jgi:hypothetical protein